jgi:hypothetical protein
MAAQVHLMDDQRDTLHLHVAHESAKLRLRLLTDVMAKRSFGGVAR